MKPANHARQALLATVIAGTTVISTGCTSGGISLASLNPFTRSAATVQPTNDANPTGRVTESLASTANGTRNQFSTLGATAKSALGKTTNAVASVFSPGKAPVDEGSTDPLSLSNKPKSVGPEVYVANGQLWESTGDFGKAMESYTKALENEPSNAPALTSIARLHFRQGNHKLAADFFGRAIAQSPNDAGLHNDLGLTLSKLGNHAAASKSLERALEIAPGTSRYANNLASVKFEAGNTNSAYEVLAKNNKPAVAHFNMAYLHFKNGQMNEARGHLGQALQSQPQASGDAAVQRAVDRSRDMLAQIEASMAPIAQAAPQARVAGGHFLADAAATQPVKQTSQSVASKAGVAPAAAPMAPAMSGITAPSPATLTTTAPEDASSSSDSLAENGDDSPVAATSGSSSWGTSATDEAATGKMPVKPSSTATTDTEGPSVPFSMPTGFSTPQ